MPVLHCCSCHFEPEPSKRAASSRFSARLSALPFTLTGMKEPENVLRSNFLPVYTKLRTREDKDGHVGC